MVILPAIADLTTLVEIGADTERAIPILIYTVENETVTFYRTGTQADLFH